MDSGQGPRIRVAALTPRGARIALRIHREMESSRLWLPESTAGRTPGAEGFRKVSEVFEGAFRKGEALVCVMAAGIVVRSIAPLLRGKDRDPAVVVADERGRFVVSLLSGHIGGANALARRVAHILHATPVITTATDVHGLPALDVLAVEQGLRIENLEALPRVQMAFLKGEPLRIVDPQRRLHRVLAKSEAPIHWADPEEALEAGGATVYVGSEERPWPGHWLRLRPPELTAGVGCNRGTPASEILEAVRGVFAEEGLACLSLRRLASIEAKRNEHGLVEAARELGVECVWFARETLQKQPVPNPSATVHRHMGVESVCEAAAMLASRTDRLVVPKRKRGNVTVAVARDAFPW